MATVGTTASAIAARAPASVPLLLNGAALRPVVPATGARAGRRGGFMLRAPKRGHVSPSARLARGMWRFRTVDGRLKVSAVTGMDRDATVKIEPPSVSPHEKAKQSLAALNGILVRYDEVHARVAAKGTANLTNDEKWVLQDDALKAFAKKRLEVMRSIAGEGDDGIQSKKPERLARFYSIISSEQVPMVAGWFLEDEGSVVIGRKGNIRFGNSRDMELSRHHATMRRTPWFLFRSGVQIRDGAGESMGLFRNIWIPSTNGTFVNGARIEGWHTLQPGDQIAMGAVSFIWPGKQGVRIMSPSNSSR